MFFIMLNTCLNVSIKNKEQVEVKVARSGTTPGQGGNRPAVDILYPNGGYQPARLRTDIQEGQQGFLIELTDNEYNYKPDVTIILPAELNDMFFPYGDNQNVYIFPFRFINSATYSYPSFNSIKSEIIWYQKDNEDIQKQLVFNNRKWGYKLTWSPEEMNETEMMNFADTIQKNAKNIRQQIMIKKSGLFNLSSQYKTTQSTIEGIQIKNKDALKTFKEEKTKEIKDETAKLVKLNTQLGKDKKAIATSSEKIIKLQGELKKLNATKQSVLDEKKAAYDAMQSDFKEKEKANKKTLDELTELQNKNGEIRKNYENKDQHYQDTKNTLENEKKELDARKEALRVAEEKHNANNIKNEAVKAESANLKEEYKHSVEANQANIKKANEELTKTDAQMKKYDTDFAAQVEAYDAEKNTEIKTKSDALTKEQENQSKLKQNSDARSNSITQLDNTISNLSAAKNNLEGLSKESLASQNATLVQKKEDYQNLLWSLEFHLKGQPQALKFAEASFTDFNANVNELIKITPGTKPTNPNK
jgi:chromosome segregation ATPase